MKVQRCRYFTGIRSKKINNCSRLPHPRQSKLPSCQLKLRLTRYSTVHILCIWYWIIYLYAPFTPPTLLLQSVHFVLASGLMLLQACSSPVIKSWDGDPDQKRFLVPLACRMKRINGVVFSRLRGIDSMAR